MLVGGLVFCALVAALFAPLRAAYIYTRVGGGSARSGENINATSFVGADSAIFDERSAEASAQASYGRVGVEAYSNCVFSLGLYCNGRVNATAEFSDALTFRFSGYIEAQVYFFSGNLDGESTGALTIGTQSAQWFGGRPPFPANPRTLRSPFTAGIPLTLFGHMDAFACQDGGYLCWNGSSYGQASGSFRQFAVFDLNNNPVSNFSYVTESRSPYNIAGGTNASVPEPATFVAAGVMLLALFGHLRYFAGRGARRDAGWQVSCAIGHSHNGIRQGNLNNV